MARGRANVFNIPAGIAFARALCEGIIARGGAGDPLALSDALILVPTRRAVRALHDMFGGCLGGAALLPRIVALASSRQRVSETASGSTICGARSSSRTAPSLPQDRPGGQRRPCRKAADGPSPAASGRGAPSDASTGALAERC